jgi:hypothetical protein
MIDSYGAGDGTRIRPTSFQVASDGHKSFRLITGCRDRCSLSQPVLAGCYHDVITDMLLRHDEVCLNLELPAAGVRE